MSFLFLLLTSAIPVVKVCLLSLVGVALAHLVSPTMEDVHYYAPNLYMHQLIDLFNCTFCMPA